MSCISWHIYLCIYIYTWLLSSTGDCAFASFSLVPQQTMSGWENSAENGGFLRKNLGKYGKISNVHVFHGKIWENIQKPWKIWGKYGENIGTWPIFMKGVHVQVLELGGFSSQRGVDFPISKFSNHSQFAEINKVRLFWDVVIPRIPISFQYTRLFWDS